MVLRFFDSGANSGSTSADNKRFYLGRKEIVVVCLLVVLGVAGALKGSGFSV